MLVVKIDIEQNKENYQAVLKALEAFDILSASWEDESKAANVTVDPKLRVSGEGSDLGAAVSAAVDRLVQNRRGRGV